MKLALNKILRLAIWILLIVVIGEVMIRSERVVPEVDTKGEEQNVDVSKKQGQIEDEISQAGKKDGESGVQNATFDFPEKGTYHKNAFGDEYFVYRFVNTDLVVFCLFEDTYIIGKDVKECTEGPSLGHIPKVDSQFVGLSDEYMLFLTKDGLMAVELEEKQETREDGKYLVHEAVPYEELTKGEQTRFIYPTAYEKVTNSAS